MDWPAKRVDDVMNYLTREPLMEFTKGSVIYSRECESLYLVAYRRMKVWRFAADGRETTGVRHSEPFSCTFTALGVR
jgi:hypothetical protein